MLTALAVAVTFQGQSFGSDLHPRTPREIYVGIDDEMNDDGWGPLGMENRARAIHPLPGMLSLSLGRVPPTWPYAYQWSGVTRDLSADIARYPVVEARVMHVVGYAHLDIDVLDGDGKAVKTLRSNTLNGPGVTIADLGTSLDPATYRLRVRLIVGGDNSGCDATYRWLRFVRRADADFMKNNPDFPNVAVVRYGLR